MFRHSDSAVIRLPTGHLPPQRAEAHESLGMDNCLLPDVLCHVLLR